MGFFMSSAPCMVNSKIIIVSGMPIRVISKNSVTFYYDLFLFSQELHMTIKSNVMILQSLHAKGWMTTLYLYLKYITSSHANI